MGFGEQRLLVRYLVTQAASLGHHHAATGEESDRETGHDQDCQYASDPDHQFAVVVDAKSLRRFQKLRYDDDIHA